MGNVATTDAPPWRALSLVSLLGGITLVLTGLGRWDFLGRKAGEEGHVHPAPTANGDAIPGHRGRIKCSLFVAVLAMAPVLLRVLVAHHRADPSSYYGLDVTRGVPSNLFRTWHLQLALFWIAICFVAGALYPAPAFGSQESKCQSTGVILLFGALVSMIGGSLPSEMLGINNRLGNLWWRLGNQGWEFLELRHVCRLVFWLVLLIRTISAAPRSGQQRAGNAVPGGGRPHPRLLCAGEVHHGWHELHRSGHVALLWIIHRWVKGFFELFATVVVAIMYFLLGVVLR